MGKKSGFYGDKLAGNFRLEGLEFKSRAVLVNWVEKSKKKLSFVVHPKTEMFTAAWWTNLQPMKIAIGCDHAGPALKMKISDLLAAAGHTVVNKGTDTLDSVDYPDFAHAVAREVSD